MSRYKKEIDAITKVLDLNQNNPMSYDDLKRACFNIKDNIFLLILSDMFAEGTLIYKNDMYQLSPVLYKQNIEVANKKRQAIIDANNRLAKIRESFNKEYYEIEKAKEQYLSALQSDNLSYFETDMKNLNYFVTSDYLIFKFASVGEYLTNELLKLDIIEINQFTEKYAPLVKELDLNYLLEKLKRSYQIIEFERDSYINIKRLNEMNIYVSDIKEYCSKTFNFAKDGLCFSIRFLKLCIKQKLDDLGMEDIFYENLLKYDGRFLFYKMGNCLVFSTVKKPSIAAIVYDVLKIKRVVSIYDLQEILAKQYGIKTNFIAESGNLINKSVLFEENSSLFYSRQLEKIYFDKEDFYKEIEYDQ